MHFMEKNCHKTKSPHSGLFAFSARSMLIPAFLLRGFGYNHSRIFGIVNQIYFVKFNHN